MFHIGIATKHPPLPEKHELSELGIDFIECCLDIDPLKRPTAAELMEHPWILEFSQQIAMEMNLHNGGGGGGSGIETIAEEDEAEEGESANVQEQEHDEQDDARQDGYYQHLEGNLEGAERQMASEEHPVSQDDEELVEQFKAVEAVDGKTAGAHG